MGSRSGSTLHESSVAVQLTDLQHRVGNQAVAQLVGAGYGRTSTAEGGLAQHLPFALGSSGTGVSRQDAAVMQRKPFANESDDLKAAKAFVKKELGIEKASQAQKALDGRVIHGPLLTSEAVFAIRNLQSNESGKAWLVEAGLGTYDGARAYLEASDYHDWLKRSSGERVLMATIAYREGIGKKSPPPPAYSLGRQLAIGTEDLGISEKASLVDEKNTDIRNAFVDTLMPPSLENVDKAGKATGGGVNAVQNDIQAREILRKVLIILQSGLKVYDKGAHLDYTEGDVVRALAHGGRVNIRIPAIKPGGNGRQLLEWIGLEKNGRRTKGVESRPFGTHSMSIGKNTDGPGSGSFSENGGSLTGLGNAMPWSDTEMFGVNVSAGGIGNEDFNGDVILPDGAHGHMFLGFTMPAADRDGALQVGIETTAPGAPSVVGYEHNWRSTEATANPESSFYGHKTDKIGGGKLQDNGRLVDLNSLQSEGSSWQTRLDQLDNDWKDVLAAATASGNKRLAYEMLAGARNGGR